MKKIISIFLSISLIALIGCSKPTKVELGTSVKITYVGTLENGTIFENETKTITVGSGEVIKGIENSLIDKEVGAKLSIDVNPEAGYGYQYLADNQQRISSYIFERLQLPTDIGQIVTLDKTTGKILSHEQDSGGNTTIVFDVNPAQTRQKVHYEIDIEEILR